MEDLGKVVVVVVVSVYFLIALYKHIALTDAFVINYKNALLGIVIIQMT